jgi:hypothetical protein
MNRPRLIQLRLCLLFAAAALLAWPSASSADHDLRGLHWARTSNPFTVKLGSNVLPEWDNALRIASEDWSQSKVLDTVIVPGQSRPQNCKKKFTPGRVEVCSGKYGFTWWLAMAQWVADGEHIVAANVIMNDHFFVHRRSILNPEIHRQQMMCHELGHTLGLGHRDEDFSNEPLGTCMDYSDDVAPNQHPDKHDYDQLELLYNHTDSFTTLDTSPVELSSELARDDFLQPASWGQLVGIHLGGAEAVYVRDLSGGQKLVTYALWAPPDF